MIDLRIATIGGALFLGILVLSGALPSITLF
jgi:hypothetical protein